MCKRRPECPTFTVQLRNKERLGVGPERRRSASAATDEEAAYARNSGRNGEAQEAKREGQNPDERDLKRLQNIEQANQGCQRFFRDALGMTLVLTRVHSERFETLEPDQIVTCRDTRKEQHADCGDCQGSTQASPVRSWMPSQFLPEMIHEGPQTGESPYGVQD